MCCTKYLYGTWFDCFDRNFIEKVKKKWNNFNFKDGKKIVLCGQTGDGKSTLINALIGVDVLLVGAEGGACTSAVIEVLANDSDELYRAKVEFLSQEEWSISLKSLWTWLQVEGLS